MDLINKLLEELEKLQMPNGAFIAAPSEEYRACWIRDQLYCALCYYYLGNIPKLVKSIRVIFEILRKHWNKIDKDRGNYIHAKYDALTFEQITDDWGHHQLDALGLLLYLTAFVESKKIKLVEEKDRELIKFLIFYLFTVEYWKKPDHGMWEDYLKVRSSSIGSVLTGLIYLDKEKIMSVPEPLITNGKKSLEVLLPNESSDRETDMAQLSLIWPYNIVEKEMAEIILQRIKENLAKEHGLNRYLGDRYYESDDNSPAEWPLGLFWLALAEFQISNIEEAKFWLEKGLKQITDNHRISELYQNGQPNKNTPLAWAMSFAIIALILIKQKKQGI